VFLQKSAEDAEKKGVVRCNGAKECKKAQEKCRGRALAEGRDVNTGFAEGGTEKKLDGAGRESGGKVRDGDGRTTGGMIFKVYTKSKGLSIKIISV
jgi:hypothetical protein